jgi:ribosomal protein S18 acetylase RimI-like enzyme
MAEPAVGKKALAKARTAFENARAAGVKALLWQAPSSDGAENAAEAPRDLLAAFAALASAPLPAAAGATPSSDAATGSSSSGGGGGGSSDSAVRITFTSPRARAADGCSEAWSPAVEQWVLSLTKRNMASVYDASSDERWHWSDARKRGELLDGETRYLVARLGGALAAFLAFRLLLEGDAEVLYVYELQAEASARRRGLGKRLMQLAELIARRHALQAVVLTVLKHNAGAVDFYTRKLGYAADASSPSRCGDADAAHEILSKVAHAGAAKAKAAIADAFAAGRLPADLLASEIAYARPAAAPIAPAPAPAAH